VAFIVNKRVMGREISLANHLKLSLSLPQLLSCLFRKSTRSLLLCERIKAENHHALKSFNGKRAKNYYASAESGWEQEFSLPLFLAFSKSIVHRYTKYHKKLLNNSIVLQRTFAQQHHQQHTYEEGWDVNGFLNLLIIEQFLNHFDMEMPVNNGAGKKRESNLPRSN
jgi:hypothetical protein